VDGSIHSVMARPPAGGGFQARVAMAVGRGLRQLAIARAVVRGEETEAAQPVLAGRDHQRLGRIVGMRQAGDVLVPAPLRILAIGAGEHRRARMFGVVAVAQVHRHAPLAAQAFGFLATLRDERAMAAPGLGAVCFAQLAQQGVGIVGAGQRGQQQAGEHEQAG